MKLIDLNHAGGIGANSHFVKIGSFNILVDAGLHPKEMGRSAMPDYDEIDGIDLDLIILTHCHLDHLGSLPVIAAQHPNAEIITSIPNKTLAPRMLRNSVNVMKRQREEHGLLEYPLFVHRDVAKLSKRLLTQRFNRSEIYLKDKDKIEVTLHPSGHVIGAAAVEFKHQGQRIVFSGDVLFDAQRTLPGAKLPSGDIDTLILETTRGATPEKPERTREGEIQRLLEQINNILQRGGSCLIPVFALGRMQELFKIIYQACQQNQLPNCPIIAAGLGMDLCNYFDDIHSETGLIDFDLKILQQMKVKILDANMRPGRDLKEKGIYLVSSGMVVEHTPSYKIAASLLPHPENGLCFVGYCDPDTPGGKLLNEPEKESYFFETLDYLAPIKASIDKFELTGHAERSELTNYAVQAKAKNIVLTHGDPDARTWFIQQLAQQLPDSQIINPSPGVLYTL